MYYEAINYRNLLWTHCVGITYSSMMIGMDLLPLILGYGIPSESLSKMASCHV